jgi:hypothetical protein
LAGNTTEEEFWLARVGSQPEELNRAGQQGTVICCLTAKHGAHEFAAAAMILDS